MEKRYRIDFLLLFSVILVVSAAIFTLYTQEIIIEDQEGSSRWFRQLVFFSLGLPLCFLFRRINYTIVGDAAIPVYLAALLLLLITLVPFIGSESKGARSWIRIAGIGFQTSEVAKLATILLLAKYLELKEKDIDKLPSLLIAFAIAVVPMLLIVGQPDFGSAFSFAPILLSMLFIAGADIYHISSVVIFFGVSLSIPLFVEYHKITLWEPLIQELIKLEKDALTPAVSILRGDIWSYVDSSIIPASVAAKDRPYLTNILNNTSLLTDLKEAASTVRYDGTGLFLRILENEILLLAIGGVMALIALGLFIVRVTQGRAFKHFRNFYIPLGVLGVSLMAASAMQMTFSFRYYQVVRVTAFVNPDKFPRDEAYHIRASKAAIGSGELTGRGLFKGDMTIGDRPLVPEAYTDFIFTSWAERTGFFGSIVLLLLLISIPLRGLQICFEARDRFGSILAAGISSMFFTHILFNIGIALGLFPVTGLPLSFMSYGGSHLIVCMMGVGFLLSIHRRRFAN